MTKKHWIAFAVAGFMNLASWLAVYFLISPAAAPFIVQYRIFGSQDIFGNRILLFQLPLMGLVILVVNFLVFREVYSRHLFMANLVIALTIFLEFLAFFGSWGIVYMNRLNF